MLSRSSSGATGSAAAIPAATMVITACGASGRSTSTSLGIGSRGLDGAGRAARGVVGAFQLDQVRLINRSSSALVMAPATTNRA